MKKLTDENGIEYELVPVKKEPVVPPGVIDFMNHQTKALFNVQTHLFHYGTYEKTCRYAFDRGYTIHKIEVNGTTWEVGEKVIAEGNEYVIESFHWVVNSWTARSWTARFSDKAWWPIERISKYVPRPPRIMKDAWGTEKEIKNGDILYKVYPGNQWATAERQVRNLFNSMEGTGGGLNFFTAESREDYIHANKPVISQKQWDELKSFSQSVVDAEDNTTPWHNFSTKIEALKQYLQSLPKKDI